MKKEKLYFYNLTAEGIGAISVLMAGRLNISLATFATYLNLATAIIN